MKFIVLVVLSFLFTDLQAVEDTFHSQYLSWVAEYKNSKVPPVYCPACLTNAERKSNAKIFATYSQDERDAVVLVNLYTQDMGGDSSKQIYRNLNAQLREGNPKSLINNFANLLNKAISILSSKSKVDCYNRVFRGMKCCDEINTNKNIHIFPEFLSTSREVSKAFQFGFCDGVCQVLVVFRNVPVSHGLSISAYSAFLEEDEVLLKSNTRLHISKNYNVTATPGDEQKIQTELKNINFPLDGKVKVFIEGYPDAAVKAKCASISSGTVLSASWAFLAITFFPASFIGQ
ncbi:uncharacterized protein LOC133206280 [Saccostrea echinata]|uniref:uncharacterized protein LOC133206280 n=1 Tax=Saccostrea echinata TaxID=191078 RepID=UPI002A82F3B5|nr:uncharacterized protein LOC133206280 [Saccostrea echinata]